jgi:trehalose synthase
LDYEPLVGRSAIEEISLLAEKLSGKVVQNINSTRSGGGVAEVLSRMVPLLQQVGVEAQWNVIKGNQEFFQVTKKFHNALQGKEESISPEEFSLLLEPSQGTVEEYLHGDIIFIHDPQPIALIAKRRELGEKWVWRCHIDVSNPRPEAWDFVREFVVQYDAAVFSTASFSQELPIRQFLIPPSIDPLSEKNKELSGNEIESVLAKYGIPQDKPIITQVSRFDHLKDPIGVIRAFEMVRRNMDCRLVLAGGTAVDDPEADRVLAEVKERAAGNEDIHVLSLPPESGREINALQRASTVVLQKSLKEGFGLTVSEALWKGKPVVVSAVGGMRLQVKNRFNGLLCHGVEGAAYALRLLLSNPEYARWLGENGREHVRRNFLITRHLKEYLLLFLSLYHPEDIIYL